mgnify:CR=1 FL=1
MNNFNPKKFLVLFLLIINHCLVFSQIKVFTWEYGLCHNSGEYDTTKYTEEQLDNTLLLFYSDYKSTIRLITPSYAWEPNELDKLSIDSLDKEYNLKRNILKNLSIVKSSFWEDVRNAKLDRMAQDYQLRTVTIKAYKNPKILKEYLPALPCSSYVEALIDGGDNMIRAWKAIKKKQWENNSDSISFIEKFNQKMNSEKRTEFAQIDIILFGWWNCAVQHFNKTISDDKIYSEYKKIFTNYKVGCK